jgi:hypothetical protein
MPDPIIEETTPQAPPIPDPVEEKARLKGWKPKEEFDGDHEDWIDANEFIKREPLFDKIRNQSKEIKEMRKTVEAMANHFQKATKVAVDKAISELKSQRKEAIELGNVEAVEDIDKQIEEHKISVQDAPKTPSVPKEIIDWVSENKWFDSNKEMREFALAYQETQMRNNPGIDLEIALGKTTTAVRRAFPEEFENKRKSEPPPVEGTGTKGSTGNGKYTVDRLTSEQKLVYKQMVQQFKQLSHEEYFKSLEEIGELK